MKLTHSSLLTGTVLGIAGLVAFSSGCELVAGIDRSTINQGSGGALASTSSSSSSSSSSSGETGGGGMGGMGGGGGAGGGSVCMMATDCPAPANECIKVDCMAGMCVETNVAADTPLGMAQQVAGDCKQAVCDGNGAIASKNDDTDPQDDGKGCTTDTCSGGMPVHTNVASGMTCTDGGGKVCNAMGGCVECNTGADCMSNVCQANACQAAACGDMTQNGTETDVDCGGTCGGCADMKKCMVGMDCLSQVCTGMTCQVPSCTDTKQNGMETDVDCGGPCPADCMNGQGCMGNNDCTSGFCNPMMNKCAAPACNDTYTNGDETDTDCGGSCMTDCMNGLNCVIDADCASGYCNGMNKCATPTCMDMDQNQDESDVDCGGNVCAPCMDGKNCMLNTDCSSTYCNGMNKCAAPTCTDMAKNGTETDIDCGGAACPKCADTKACNGNADCQNGYCNAMMKCATPTCNDMVQNGTETGVDCGGTCLGCNGSACTMDSQCKSGMCYGGSCVANVNGCDVATATDYTVMAPPNVTFPNGNFTYMPKCIKVKANTMVTFAGNFMFHSLQGGQVVAGVGTPAAGGPFVPATSTGMSATFNMSTVGTFPYYCVQHQGSNMSGAVFVVP